LPIKPRSKAPLEKIDISGGDLEVFALSKLQRAPDTNAIELALRSTELRTNGRKPGSTRLR